MAKFISLVFVSLFTASAWAASPFLEISATNTFRSAERAAVEAAISQAEAEGKPVIIEPAAAWCGPCLQLETEIENRKAEFEPLFAKFVYIKLEEMHFETFTADYMPFEVAWFPSFVIYNPATNKWTALAATTGNELLVVLNEYLANPSLADLYTERLLTLVRGTEKVDFDSILNALIPLSVEADAARYLAVWGEISTLLDAQPERFQATPDQIREYMKLAHNRLIERGVATLADIRAVDAKAYAGHEEDIGSIHTIEFHIPLGKLIRTQGNAAAADQCQSLSTKVAGMLSGASAEEQRLLQILRESFCMLLDIQLQRKSGVDARAWLATLTASEKNDMSDALMKIFALTGTDYDLALEYGTIIQQAYLESFKSHPEMLARVTAATNARLDAYRANKSHP